MLIAVSFGVWGRNPIFHVYVDCKPNFRNIKRVIYIIVMKK